MLVKFIFQMTTTLLAFNLRRQGTPGPRLLNFVSCSTQLSMEFQLLIKNLRSFLLNFPPILYLSC